MAQSKNKASRFFDIFSRKVLARRVRKLRRTRWLQSGVEQLEVRTLLSTIHVTIDDDSVNASDGQTSLREAITQANNNDTIDFQFATNPGGQHTVNLTRPLVDLSKSITINGPGRDKLTVQRNSSEAFRIFTVTGAVTVNISGLAIKGGKSTQGGGIYNGGGTLTVTNSDIVENHAIGVPGNNVEDSPSGPGGNGGDGGVGAGGGIYNAGGELTLDNTTLKTNKAKGGTGGTGGKGGKNDPEAFDGGSGGIGGLGLGGGLYVADGVVNVWNQSSLSEKNEAIGGTGGTGGNGGYSSAIGDRGNGGQGGQGRGGGIYVAAGGRLDVNEATISNSHATRGIGGTWGYEGFCPDGSFCSHGAVGSVGGDSNGGGLYVSGGTVTVSAGTIKLGKADQGAGIYIAGGAVTIGNGSSLSNNLVLLGI